MYCGCVSVHVYLQPEASSGSGGSSVRGQLGVRWQLSGASRTAEHSGQSGRCQSLQRQGGISQVTQCRQCVSQVTQCRQCVSQVTQCRRVTGDGCYSHGPTCQYSRGADMSIRGLTRTLGTVRRLTNGVVNNPLISGFGVAFRRPQNACSLMLFLLYVCNIKKYTIIYLRNSHQS